MFNVAYIILNKIQLEDKNSSILTNKDEIEQFHRKTSNAGVYIILCFFVCLVYARKTIT